MKNFLSIVYENNLARDLHISLKVTISIQRGIMSRHQNNQFSQKNTFFAEGGYMEPQLIWSLLKIRHPFGARPVGRSNLPRMSRKSTMLWNFVHGCILPEVMQSGRGIELFLFSPHTSNTIQHKQQPQYIFGSWTWTIQRTHFAGVQWQRFAQDEQSLAN